MSILPTEQVPLWLNIALFLAASVVVWIGGTRLTNYVDAISESTGMGKAFAGMLLLGVITSLPEVANAISASSVGSPDLAINNLLGSASINVFMLALGDAFVRREALTSVVAKPSILMMSVLCIVVLMTVAMAISVGDLPFAGVVIWSLAITGVSVGSFWLASGYDRRSSWSVDRGGDAKDDDLAEKPPLESNIWKTAVAGSLIFIAGFTLSETGDGIAEQTGLTSGIVGFALIGVATSTPELSTIVQSIRLRQYEMAFGQVLGTNFVNLSVILLSDAVYAEEPVINALGRFEIISSLLGAILIAVFMVGLLERRDRTILRMGYDSFVVLIVFASGVGLLAVIGD